MSWPGPWPLGFIALLPVALVVLWIVQRHTGVAATADLAWSLSVGALGLLLLADGDGVTWRRWLAGAVLLLWSGRLSALLASRLSLGEDSRYAAARASWGDAAQRRLLGYFLMQWPFVLLFALPFLAVARQTHGWQVTDPFALALIATGLLLTTIADEQKRRARRDRPGALCDTGLWRLSRHPNYLGEFVHWTGVGLLAWPSPLGLLPFLTPVVAWVLLRHVTGVPLAERQSLARHGDTYRRYQAAVPPFFPVPAFLRRAPAGAAAPCADAGPTTGDRP